MGESCGRPAPLSIYTRLTDYHYKYKRRIKLAACCWGYLASRTPSWKLPIDIPLLPPIIIPGGYFPLQSLLHLPGVLHLAYLSFLVSLAARRSFFRWFLASFLFLGYFLCRALSALSPLIIAHYYCIPHGFSAPIYF